MTPSAIWTATIAILKRVRPREPVVQPSRLDMRRIPRHTDSSVQRAQPIHFLRYTCRRTVFEHAFAGYGGIVRPCLPRPFFRERDFAQTRLCWSHRSPCLDGRPTPPIPDWRPRFAPAPTYPAPCRSCDGSAAPSPTGCQERMPPPKHRRRDLGVRARVAVDNLERCFLVFKQTAQCLGWHPLERVCRDRRLQPFRDQVLGHPAAQVV